MAFFSLSSFLLLVVKSSRHNLGQAQHATASHIMSDGGAPDTYISARAGRAYWQDIDADVNGMLGGIPAVSKIDLQGSRAFLAKLGIGKKEGLRPLKRVLEGGAGYVFFPFCSFFVSSVSSSCFESP